MHHVEELSSSAGCKKTQGSACIGLCLSVIFISSFHATLSLHAVHVNSFHVSRLFYCVVLTVISIISCTHNIGLIFIIKTRNLTNDPKFYLYKLLAFLSRILSSSFLNVLYLTCPSFVTKNKTVCLNRTCLDLDVNLTQVRLTKRQNASLTFNTAGVHNLCKRTLDVTYVRVCFWNQKCKRLKVLLVIYWNKDNTIIYIKVSVRRKPVIICDITSGHYLVYLSNVCQCRHNTKYINNNIFQIS